MFTYLSVCAVSSILIIIMLYIYMNRLTIWGRLIRSVFIGIMFFSVFSTAGILSVNKSLRDFVNSYHKELDNYNSRKEQDSLTDIEEFELMLNAAEFNKRINLMKDDVENMQNLFGINKRLVKEIIDIEPFK